MAFCGKGFFTFLFEKKRRYGSNFSKWTLFHGCKRNVLNKWTPYFSPKNDIPLAVHVWVRLSFLPLHCWNDETLRNIGNSLGKYIDRVEPREGLQACARICVEVDLEKGLSEAIQLTLDNLSYVQQVEYEKIPFKCKEYHE